jgi:hypothetical protein
MWGYIRHYTKISNAGFHLMKILQDLHEVWIKQSFLSLLLQDSDDLLRHKYTLWTFWENTD